MLKDSKDSASPTPAEPIVIGPTRPITAVEARTLERLKEKIREPGGGIKATPREREVIGLLALGSTDKEAAIQMRISSRTVQTHIRHFCKRNAVKNRAEATALWTGSHCEIVVRHLKEVISEIQESPDHGDRQIH